MATKFHDRVWNQDPFSGKWHSKPATKEDHERRRQLAASMMRCEVKELAIDRNGFYYANRA